MAEKILYLETKFCLRIMYYLELKSLALSDLCDMPFSVFGFFLCMREHYRSKVQIYFTSYLHRIL